uniref:Neur_chan_LBD domain-containing protein n=1 Tax=Heterorhabditis bacteriophora TaxID=37862 RepID=A0A1I7XB64_HETBA
MDERRRNKEYASEQDVRVAMWVLNIWKTTTERQQSLVQWHLRAELPLVTQRHWCLMEFIDYWVIGEVFISANTAYCNLMGWTCSFAFFDNSFSYNA